MSAIELVAPFVGAIAMEVLHWYQLREKLHLPRLRRLVRSIGYWSITILAVLVGGIGSLIYFGDRLTAGELLVAGAAFPTLLKKLTASFARERVTLGGKEAEGGPTTVPSIRDYFAA